LSDQITGGKQVSKTDTPLFTPQINILKDKALKFALSKSTQTLLQGGFSIYKAKRL
jgi:hypothetical protein